MYLGFNDLPRRIKRALSHLAVNGAIGMSTFSFGRGGGIGIGAEGLSVMTAGSLAFEERNEFSATEARSR